MCYTDYAAEEHHIVPFSIPAYVPSAWHNRIEVLFDEKGVHFLWTGWSNGKGHGKIKIDGETCYVHREIVERVDGIVLKTEDIVDHRCRHRGCINRDHLEVVTMAVNTERGLGVHSQFKPAEEYEDPLDRYRDPLDRAFG